MSHPAPIFFTRPALAAFALLTVLMVAGCGRKAEVATVAPTPVRTIAVVEGPATPPLEFTGVVAARDELRLSFKVAGVVQRVTVREGDTVRKGQVLAELDPTEIGAQLEQARQMAEKAERDRQRGEALYADQVIPLEQLQNLRTQSEVAASQLRAARFNREYAAITAPSDGVVLRRTVEERELAAPGQVVLMLGRADSGYVVRFAVADRDVVRLKRGAAVELRLDAWPEQVFQAEVRQIAGAADIASGLFEIEAALAPTQQPLATGLVGRVRLQPESSGEKLAYVPIGAVLEGHEDHARVFVTEGGVAHSRDVQVAFITADSVALRAGVKPGEQVIAVGAPYVEDGGHIAIVP
ncbi:MAG TPA: efflux RND transporter periplasmic adaptor subunit [Steroidobacteraceae bacterium]|nr:efflux RND transporter periplasmic adaptor subunit [Steroidobacteraceae bacterium]